MSLQEREAQRGPDAVADEAAHDAIPVAGAAGAPAPRESDEEETVADLRVPPTREIRSLTKSFDAMVADAAVAPGEAPGPLRPEPLEHT